MSTPDSRSFSGIVRLDENILETIEQSRRLYEQLPPEIQPMIENIRRLLPTLPFDPPLPPIVIMTNPPVMIDLTANPTERETAE